MATGPRIKSARRWWRGLDSEATLVGKFFGGLVRKYERKRGITSEIFLTQAPETDPVSMN